MNYNQSWHAEHCSSLFIIDSEVSRRDKFNPRNTGKDLSTMFSVHICFVLGTFLKNYKKYPLLRMTIFIQDQFLRQVATLLPVRWKFHILWQNQCPYLIQKFLVNIGTIQESQRITVFFQKLQKKINLKYKTPREKNFVQKHWFWSATFSYFYTDYSISEVWSWLPNKSTGMTFIFFFFRKFPSTQQTLLRPT